MATAWSCREMYGTLPTTRNSVARAPSQGVPPAEGAGHGRHVRGAAEAAQLPQDRPQGEGEDRRADEEGEEGRAGLRGVPDTPVKRPGGAVDPRGEDVDGPVQPAGAQGVELPLAEIPDPEQKEQVPR